MRDLNPFDLNPQQLRIVQQREPCLVCGRRLGLHRYRDNTCPNPTWYAGSGRPQWLDGKTFKGYS